MILKERRVLQELRTALYAGEVNPQNARVVVTRREPTQRDLDTADAIVFITCPAKKTYEGFYQIATYPSDNPSVADKIFIRETNERAT